VPWIPALALAEYAAAIARQTSYPALAKELVGIIEDFPGINLISLDLSLARKAAQITVEHRLRGADAAYVAVVDTLDATLISWDQVMPKRCPAAVDAMTAES
jgi:predicted nucleic acid-binding protein